MGHNFYIKGPLNYGPKLKFTTITFFFGEAVPSTEVKCFYDQLEGKIIYHYQPFSCPTSGYRSSSQLNGSFYYIF